jgi:hypothetical protein
MYYVNQISVFVENKTGSLANVTKVLANAGIDIRAFSIADTSEFGILRMIVDKPEKAMTVLNAERVTAILTPVLAVKLLDKPGAMNSVMAVLSAEGVAVEYAYAFVTRDREYAYVVLRVDEPGSVGAMLRENGFTVIGNDEIESLT